MRMALSIDPPDSFLRQARCQCVNESIRWFRPRRRWPSWEIAAPTEARTPRLRALSSREVRLVHRETVEKTGSFPVALTVHVPRSHWRGEAVHRGRWIVVTFGLCLLY